jgi:hypothetical protein
VRRDSADLYLAWHSSCSVFPRKLLGSLGGFFKAGLGRLCLRFTTVIRFPPPPPACSHTRPASLSHRSRTQMRVLQGDAGSFGKASDGTRPRLARRAAHPRHLSCTWRGLAKHGHRPVPPDRDDRSLRFGLPVHVGRLSGSDAEMWASGRRRARPVQPGHGRECAPAHTGDFNGLQDERRAYSRWGGP